MAANDYEWLANKSVDLACRRTGGSEPILGGDARSLTGYVQSGGRRKISQFRALAALGLQ